MIEKLLKLVDKLGNRINIETHASAIRGLLDATYPIGSIYMTVSNANPSELLGGGVGSYFLKVVPL
jgi:hypothetical protein